MPSQPTGRPSLLANLILMLLVGGMLVGFFALIRGCDEAAGDARIGPLKKPETAAEPVDAGGKQPDKEAVAKAVAEANQVRKSQAVERDPAEAERTRQLLQEAPAGKPFSAPPPGQQSGEAPAPAPPMTAGDTTASEPPSPGAGEESPPPAPEPVREVAASSAEGMALVKDAAARVDEAPEELYSEKAKAKVREGLQQARRIFKVHTVYFEKGGANLGAQGGADLNKALAEPALAEVLDDPRAVFFVLGFADKSGNEDINKRLSKERSDAVIQLLKQAGVLNLTYPVAIGSTELVSPENQHKNRAAEVWLVLP